ncbi:hypothetical protein FLM48_00115 [Shewanella sp. Scap07]|uniref:hypothetical protein n=1 Tax=Shewanella sp. Scap07 TaxID=2589987 RepID=UPI0015BB7050|nr:hypothetical protein [Shewanella sp. Scap07]QLE83632.1 hypothetical protein FLM48_00115 [Shewanella sp. Scap07]
MSDQFDSQKFELLALLSKECERYSLIPTSDLQQRREQKSFINGLMTASRIFNVSYDELNNIISTMTQPKFESLDEKLAVPTYIRNQSR